MVLIFNRKCHKHIISKECNNLNIKLIHTICRIFWVIIFFIVHLQANWTQNSFLLKNKIVHSI